MHFFDQPVQTRPTSSTLRTNLDSFLWTAIGLLSTCVIMGCGSSPDLDTSRKFQQAEEAFEKGVQPDEFVRVAAMYQEILDGGFVSGSVLYNQGNAWMQAQQKGQAIACYRQAQQHLPRDPYLAANLNQALTTQPQAKQPLLNYVFFWQQSLSYREKGLLVTGLLAVVLLLFLTAGATRNSKLPNRLGWAAVVAFVLVAGSLLRDWYNFEWTSHGVITVAECTARKGGSQTYEPAFTQPLAEGTEFTVIQEQNDWLNIQIADSGEAWISKTECVTYPK